MMPTMKAGIVGISGAGRQTLFHLLTHAEHARPVHTARLGVLKIPDPRLEELARLKRSRKFTPVTIEFVLVPGLIKGESREKLNLPALSNVDVLVHVVRAFEEPSVAHPEGTVDAARDIEIMELELTLADLGIVERRIKRLQADVKRGKKPELSEMALLEKARKALATGTPLRAHLSPEEQQRLCGYALLTAKPMLLVVNVGEEAAGTDPSDELGLERWSVAPATRMCFVSARIEAEIAELPPEDQRSFRDDLGLSQGAADRVVRTTFDLTSMITFFTAEEKEARAWLVSRGIRAVAAAGAVHSDMERGFIRAEVIPFDVLAREGSWSVCRDKGLIRVEGKDYQVTEGDVIYFRFNV